jgi:hypothetical protein
MKDKLGWQHQVLEHRRALFERVVEMFPDLLKTRRSDVEIWRIKLSGPKTSLSS